MSYLWHDSSLWSDNNLKMKVKSLSHVRLFATPWTIRFLRPWDFLGKNTGVGCRFLLQIIIWLSNKGIQFTLKQYGFELHRSRWDSDFFFFSIINTSLLHHLTIHSWWNSWIEKLKLEYFGHLMWSTNWLEKALMLGKIEGRRRRGWQRMRWLEMGPRKSPLIQWTWVWASSGSWWWTGKPGVLQSKGSQRVGHDWVTEQQQHGCGPVYVEAEYKW